MYQMDESAENDESNEELDELVEWAEKENHMIIYFAALERKKFETHFPMSAFLYGSVLDSNNQGNCLRLFNEGSCCERASDGLGFNTGACRTSVISKCQYHAYPQILNLPSIVK